MTGVRRLFLFDTKAQVIWFKNLRQKVQAEAVKHTEGTGKWVRKWKEDMKKIIEFNN